jgi:hypothetical protein
VLKNAASCRRSAGRRDGSVVDAAIRRALRPYVVTSPQSSAIVRKAGQIVVKSVQIPKKRRRFVAKTGGLPKHACDRLKTLRLVEAASAIVATSGASP